ncbi:hypothetical protein A1OE_566 [Candidatus Endolissoclinum faulkneri L2]|uniref:Uncharacterized protein n=1 Tax=Candidatus Endolissoclinum faulkneri L2 TaxID=1193729 RepID=K7YML0_9PROT|nr:hypothetical protein A1OE_566 [Candidatus Endolissoclinum faulkneri L2]
MIYYKKNNLTITKINCCLTISSCCLDNNKNYCHLENNKLILQVLISTV